MVSVEKVQVCCHHLYAAVQSPLLRLRLKPVQVALTLSNKHWFKRKMSHLHFSIWQSTEMHRYTVSSFKEASENFVIFVCLFLVFTSSLNSTIKRLFPVPPFPLPKPTALLSFCPSFPCQRIFVFRTFKTGSTGKLSCHFVCKPATASTGTGQAPC